MRTEVLLTGDPVGSLDECIERGGGTGLNLALQLGTDGVLDELDISGLLPAMRVAELRRPPRGERDQFPGRVRDGVRGSGRETASFVLPAGR